MIMILIRTNRSHLGILPLILVLMSLFSSAMAAAESAGKKEVGHLLEYVAQSGCVFIRNGEEHQAGKAREHMENKYAYAKLWIDDGDDFIKRIATESSTTGKKYEIRCNGRTQYSGDWLKAELDRYRSR